MISTLARYDAWRCVQVIGDWFVLTRNGSQARCEIRTHPLGWELRLIGAAGDGFETTQVCKTEQETFDTADRWKAAMLDKDWE